MARTKNTTYFVYGYNQSLTGFTKTVGEKVCSTWNMAKALYEYAKLIESPQFDHVILFRESEIFAQVDKPV